MDLLLPKCPTSFYNQPNKNIPVYPIGTLINGESLDEKLVEGFVPLSQGEIATLSWYTGTEYHEIEKSAKYQYYTLNEEPLSIEGVLGKNGYAEYDLSNVPNGLYWISHCGLINIEK